MATASATATTAAIVMVHTHTYTQTQAQTHPDIYNSPYSVIRQPKKYNSHIDVVSCFFFCNFNIVHFDCHHCSFQLLFFFKYLVNCIQLYPYQNNIARRIRGKICQICVRIKCRVIVNVETHYRQFSRSCTWCVVQAIGGWYTQLRCEKWI